jgi:transcription antitermination factor NusG
METYQPAQQWFALRVKSHCEKVVAAGAHHKGFDHFLPLCKQRNRWSDRVKSVEVPLFPGYVFCRLSPGSRLPLLTIPGALHFVGIGRTPVPIDDQEMAAIQTAVRSELRTEPWRFLDVGHRVRLGTGPLAGLEGFLIQSRKQHRVVVSVTVLRRSVAVEIERQWIQPAELRGHAAPAVTYPVADPNSVLHDQTRPC